MTNTAQPTVTTTTDYDYNTNAMNKTYNTMTDGYVLINNMKNVTTDGSGSCWIYHTNPDGTKEIREYASQFYPIQTLDFDAHTYKDYAPAQSSSNWSATFLASHYGTAGGLGDSTAFSKTIPVSIEYGTKIEGTRVADDDTNAKKNIQNIHFHL